MLCALEEGYNVALTADMPKVARVAGLGIVKLASASGRPIYPIAIATHRRVELATGTARRSTFRSAAAAGLPASRCACRRTPMARRSKPRGGRSRLSLNAATARAYAIADRRKDNHRG